MNKTRKRTKTKKYSQSHIFTHTHKNTTQQTINRKHSWERERANYFKKDYLIYQLLQYIHKFKQYNEPVIDFLSYFCISLIFMEFGNKWFGKRDKED